MRNEGWRHADDIDLRAVFSESFSVLPPEEVVRDVTPWKRAMNRVLIGMVLCTITLNFWYLNYILPAVGMVLWLLGLRALRRENGYFTACFVLILLRCACFFPTLILNTFACRDDFISRACHRLSDSGLRCGAAVGPILPVAGAAGGAAEGGPAAPGGRRSGADAVVWSGVFVGPDTVSRDDPAADPVSRFYFHPAQYLQNYQGPERGRVHHAPGAGEGVGPVAGADFGCRAGAGLRRRVSVRRPAPHGLAALGGDPVGRNSRDQGPPFWTWASRRLS